jgi:uncharacterized SAM-binding protein YcdF (DUF218 family)
VAISGEGRGGDVFFRLSTLLYVFTRPSSLIVVFLVVGLLVRRFAPARVARWGGRLAALGLALFLVATVTPLPTVLMWTLENRFPDAVAATDPAPAGIVLLGGGTDGHREEVRGQTAFLEGAEAIFEAIRLAKRWPSVPILLTGSGSGDIGDDGTDYTEAGSMARLLTEAGIDPARLILERRARTTWENALYSRDMVHPEPGARWVLVTQAWHMPRSVGAFRAAGWTVVAHPAAWMTDPRLRLRPPSTEGLRQLDFATKELFGLVGYRLTGRSSELWPAP